jgi:hygromycin-B 7''-O-kinase
VSDSFAMARARRALAEAGLDYQMPLRRADSVTNEVWLSDEYVVRVNRRPNQRLRREAVLGPALPPEVGYPEVIGYGGALGADWLVLRRIGGVVLSRCWPTMEEDARREAVHQLAARMRAIHQFPPPLELPPTDSPQLLGAETGRATVAGLLDELDEALTLPFIDRSLIEETREIVNRTAAHLEPWYPTTLIHGDLHFENVLWDGEKITAVLDFEYARPGPPDLELDVFLRFCAFPYLHVAEDYEHLTRAEDYASVPRWVAEAYPELFSGEHLYDRVRLFCIAYDVRDLMLHPPQRPPREISQHHPYNRLSRTVRGHSHLNPAPDGTLDLDFAAAAEGDSLGISSYVTLPPLR